MNCRCSCLIFNQLTSLEVERGRHYSISRSYLVMEGKSMFPVCIWDHQFGSPKNSSGVNDVISMFDHVLSFVQRCGLSSVEAAYCGL